MRPRVLVVDDEPLARAKIARLLGARADAELAGECATAAEAVAAVRALRPELLFLDIQLPDADGFAVLEQVGAGAVPAVVFVTAYDEFALRAFQARAVDYLLKPYDAGRFEQAYERARTWLLGAAAGGSDPRLAGLLEDIHAARASEAAVARAAAHLQRLVVPAPGGEVVIPAEEIDWLESAGNYVQVHRAGVSYLVRETLASLESRLDPARFARIHRRTVVNLERVERLQPLDSGDGLLGLRGGITLRVSRVHRAAVRAALGPDPPAAAARPAPPSARPRSVD